MSTYVAASWLVSTAAVLPTIKGLNVFGMTCTRERLFYFLECHGPLNEIHVYALHFVYLPRIRKGIRMFTEAWNNHGIRTCHHTSPRQMFVSGCLRLRYSGLIALDFLDDVDNRYGTVQGDYENDYIGVDREADSVDVPRSRVEIKGRVVC